MYTYYEYLQECWFYGCFTCSCLVDYENCPIYCNNKGKSFCYRTLSDIMFDYYFQTTGALFVPSGDFLDGLGE